MIKIFILSKILITQEIAMRSGLKLAQIKAYFEQHQLPAFNSSSIIYGMINAKAWQYTLFSGLATLGIEHLLIYFKAEKNNFDWIIANCQFDAVYNRYLNDKSFRFKFQEKHL
jgi:uncharacterized membrane protein